MNKTLENVMAVPRVDLVLLAIKDGELQVLLRSRYDGQFNGELALPGGIIEVSQDKSLDDTVRRIARKWLKRTLPNCRQVIAVGNDSRDPRKNWSVTLVYESLVQPTFVDPDQMEEKELSWNPVKDIGTFKKLNLDHIDLIGHATELALAHNRREIEELRFPNGWVPSEFTMVELHAMCQSIMNKRLDILTFRRRMEAAGLAKPLDGKTRSGGAHRPAQIYSLVAVQAGQTGLTK